METIELISHCDQFLRIAVLITVLIVIVQRILRGEQATPLVFFAFSMASLLMSDCYWLVHKVMLPDVYRVPFAAETFGENAAFLLLAASLASAVQEFRKPLQSWALAGTVLFMTANIVLWIVWSGEWLRNIIGGVTFGYCVCLIVRTLKEREVFSRNEWVFIGCVGVVLLAIETVWTFSPEQIQTKLDVVAWLLMLCGVVFFFFRVFRAIRNKKYSRSLMPLATASFLWNSACMYMCEEPSYSILSILVTLTIPMMLEGVIREVKAA